MIKLMKKTNLIIYLTRFEMIIMMGLDGNLALDDVTVYD